MFSDKILPTPFFGKGTTRDKVQGHHSPLCQNTVIPRHFPDSSAYVKCGSHYGMMHVLHQWHIITDINNDENTAEKI